MNDKITYCILDTLEATPYRVVPKGEATDMTYHVERIQAYDEGVKIQYHDGLFLFMPWHRVMVVSGGE